MYVCVLPFFLPVDIQHIQCPLPILPPREIYTSSAVTKPRHRECIPWSQKVTYTHIIRLTVVVTSSCWPWYHTRRYIIQPTAHSHNYDHPGGHRITGILCRTPYVRIHILRSIPWYSRISRKRRGHARARTYIYICMYNQKEGWSLKISRRGLSNRWIPHAHTYMYVQPEGRLEFENISSRPFQ